MRLVCNGVALDLMSNTKISFKRNNTLFAFDNISCDRTQSFDVPATPKNERVFGLAKLPAFYGEGMRRRFDCELQEGAVVKRGSLYVTEYVKGVYKCIFVFGENMEIKRISELGTLDKVFDREDVPQSVVWDGIAVEGGGADQYVTFHYWSGRDEQLRLIEKEIKPSAPFGGLLDDAVNKVGLVLVNAPSVRDWRVIPETMYGLNGRELEFGEVAQLYWNLPKVTVFDMLKVVAFMSGKLLDFDGTTVEFVDDINGGSPIEIDGKVIGIDSISRTVPEFGKTNTIESADDKDAIADHKRRVVYDISNDYLTDERKLYEAPYNNGQGEFAEQATPTDLRIISLGGETLCRVENGRLRAMPREIPTNPLLQRLMDKSTTETVRIRMSLYEFGQVKSQTMFLHAGTMYVWTEATWSDGVATLKLSAIS